MKLATHIAGDQAAVIPFTQVIMGLRATVEGKVIFYRLRSLPGRIEVKEAIDVQRPAPKPTQTGHEVCSSSKEDGKGQSSGEAAEEEVN